MSGSDSHVMTKSVGHKTEFWENSKFLLENAKEAKIHEPVDYSIYTVTQAKISRR